MRSSLTLMAVSSIVSEIKRDIGRKLHFYTLPLNQTVIGRFRIFLCWFFIGGWQKQNQIIFSILFSRTSEIL